MITQKRPRLTLVAGCTPATSLSEGATKWDVCRGRVREVIGRVLKWLGVPGVVQEVKFHDDLTRTEIQVKVGVLFTCISVNGRDYYFNRLSGRFDGTGSGCC